MILEEAVRWLSEHGTPMWKLGEVSQATIDADIKAGLFVVAESSEELLGTMKFQLEDPLFWPDIPAGESAFVHRLAVRRRWAGGKVSSQLMQWAAREALLLGRPFLRLDCDAARPRLRAVYERCGFTHHSDRQVGPYYVARYEFATGAKLRT